MSLLDRTTPAEILDFESINVHGMHKDRAIRERFDCSPAVYLQHLYRLIDDPAVYALDPILVAAIQRSRERRRVLRIPGVADIPGANPRQRQLPPITTTPTTTPVSVVALVVDQIDGHRFQKAKRSR